MHMHIYERVLYSKKKTLFCCFYFEKFQIKVKISLSDRLTIRKKKNDNF